MKQHIKVRGMLLSLVLFCLSALPAYAQDGTPITAGNGGSLQAVGSLGASGTFASNTSIAFSPDNLTLASCGASGIELWNTSTGAARLLVDVPCSVLAFSPDGGAPQQASRSKLVRLSAMPS